MQDVRKEFNFCKKVSLPVIGVVENMKGFVCPKCTKESEIFPSGGACQKMCDDYGLRLLGQVPLDPRIGKFSEAASSLENKSSSSQQQLP